MSRRNRHQKAGHFLHPAPDRPPRRTPALPCARGCFHHSADSGDAVAREASHGLLCAGCHNRMLGWLDDIGEMYALLDDVLLPGSVVLEPTERHSRKVEAPAPARLDVLSLRDIRTRGEHVEDLPSVPDVLNEVAWRIRRGLHLSHPAGPTVVRDLATVRTHLGWLETQPDVPAVYEKIRRLQRALATATGEQAKPIGRCPQLLDDGTYCHNSLWAPRPRSGEQARRNDGTIICRSCGATWQQEQWLRFHIDPTEETG